MAKLCLFPVSRDGHEPTLKIGITRTKSPMDAFQVEKVSISDDKEAIFVVSDIYTLMNQQRLMNLPPMYLENLVTNLKSQSPATKLSDEQLLGSLKSRYIQSNADLYNWTRSIQFDLDSVVDSIKEEVAAQAAAAQEPAAQVPAVQASAAQAPATGNGSSE